MKEIPATPASDLFARVASRVRKAREIKGLSRKALSESSGVSPRYLALLEGGEGNISIALLDRVAQALDLPIEALVARDDPWTAEGPLVARLFAAAPAETRSRIVDLLTRTGDAARARRVALIGLRGAGKSTLGARAGKAMGVPFVELNREIEGSTGMPLAEVMAFYGQDGYRRLESQALDRVIDRHERVILAVAGGIVADPETFARLLARFHTIWVQATPEEHMARVRSQGDLRPMEGNAQAMEHLRGLLSSRESLYGQAEAVLSTAGQSVAQSEAALVALIRERGFLS